MIILPILTASLLTYTPLSLRLGECTLHGGGGGGLMGRGEKAGAFPPLPMFPRAPSPPLPMFPRAPSPPLPMLLAHLVEEKRLGKRQRRAVVTSAMSANEAPVVPPLHMPTCHFSILRRFMTFFYYLHEPDEGGETAFPIADNETIAPEVRPVSSGRVMCAANASWTSRNLAFRPHGYLNVAESAVSAEH